MQLQNWISSQFPKKVLLFAFFSRSRNPDEYFREIYLYCQNHIKDLAMATVSSLAPENYSMPGPCFQCAKNDISALTGVHIFCTIDTRERERERERAATLKMPLCWHFNIPSTAAAEDITSEMTDIFKKNLTVIPS